MDAEWPPLTIKGLEEALRRAASRHNETHSSTWQCPRALFMPAVRLLSEAGARLLTLSALRGENEELVMTYTFELGRRSGLVLRTPTEARAIESLFSSFPAADFLEREVNTLFGVKFLGHPNLPGRKEPPEAGAV